MTPAAEADGRIRRVMQTRLHGWILAFSLCASVLAGCAGEADRQLELNQFAGGVDTSAGAAAPRTVYAPVNRERAQPETIVIRPTETTAQAGDPVMQEPSETESLGGGVYDAKIGDINGRPIIASRFLEDLMPRLMALSVETAAGGRAEWRREARTVIARKLDGMIRDEVLYREGRARNPDYNEQGVLFYVDFVRQHIIRQSGGSATMAEQELMAQEGQTMEEFLSSVERQKVIKDVLDIVAEDYAPVSWLDIQNEYQRRYKTFNPDPLVFFRLISPVNDEATALIEERLAGGEAFESVAKDSSVNSFAPERGGLFAEQGTTIVVPLAEATLINDASLNEALVALEPGAWAGPVGRANGSAGFVMLDRVEQESASLDDEAVQLGIERYLKQLRSEQALSAFVMRLRERANLGPERFEELVGLIVDVAETRVFDPQVRG